MSTWADLDDDCYELVAEVAKKLGIREKDVVAIAVSLLARRLRMPDPADE
jgi:hypothetical protein